jgi:hypothetical protein
VIAYHTLSGVGHEAAAHIEKDAINEVRQFLDNNMLVGNLKAAVDEVRKRFQR